MLVFTAVGIESCVMFSDILIDSIIIAGSKDKFIFDFT